VSSGGGFEGELSLMGDGSTRGGVGCVPQGRAHATTDDTACHCVISHRDISAGGTVATFVLGRGRGDGLGW